MLCSPFEGLLRTAALEQSKMKPPNNRLDSKRKIQYVGLGGHQDLIKIQPGNKIRFSYQQLGVMEIFDSLASYRPLNVK